MVQNDKGRELVGSLPSDRLLTETDAPFTQVEGRPTRPSDVFIAIKAMAKLLNIPADEMVTRIRGNLKAVIGS